MESYPDSIRDTATANRPRRINPMWDDSVQGIRYCVKIVSCTEIAIRSTPRGSWFINPCEVWHILLSVCVFGGGVAVLVSRSGSVELC